MISELRPSARAEARSEPAPAPALTLRDRGVAWARRHPGLLVLLALGAGLRLVLVVVYSPAHLSYIDSWGYAKEAAGPLFLPSFYRPAGYSAFLAALHPFLGSLQITVLLQHLLGLATTALLYFATLRLGQPKWVALVPAAVVALTYDGIYYEHTLLSEWLFLLLLAGALYFVARPSERRLSTPAAVAWAVAAGLALGLAATVRGAGMFAVPVFALALLLGPAGGWMPRLAPAAALSLAALAVLLGYAVAQDRATGYLGFTNGRGWAMYARVASFADCKTFTPPAGTESLCETSDARTRQGPDHYMWQPDSPAIKLVPGGPPNQDVLFASFGNAAARAQPTAYAKVIAADLWRFVNPDNRAGFGQPPASLDLRQRNRSWEEFNRTAVGPLYGPYEIKVRPEVWHLAQFQKVVRVHGVLVAIATLLTLVGLVLAGSNRSRVTLLLLGGTALASLFMAVAVQEYNWRFAVPVLPFLLGGGAAGAAVLMARMRSRRTGAPA